jgi:hypothetical protein
MILIDPNLPLTFMYGLPAASLLAVAMLVSGKLSWPLLNRWSASNPSGLRWAATAVLFSFLAPMLAYLAFPGYLDHLEATATLLGRALGEGAGLWPDVQTDHSYRGLLYGPALAETQWLAAQLPGDPIFTSKIPGVACLLLSAVLLWPHTQHGLARCTLLMLLPFGYLLFWTRAEPMFLLLVSLAGSLTLRAQAQAGMQAEPLYLPLCIGLLMGWASAYKLHAGLYVLTAWLCLSPRWSVRQALLVAVPAAAIWLLSFVPAGPHSIQGFLSYLGLAAHHGLKLETGVKNAWLALFLALPMALAAWGRQLPLHARLQCALFAAVLALLALIGAKPGAGQHHLLPMVPIAALMWQRMSSTAPLRSRALALAAALCFAPSALANSSYICQVIWRDLDTMQSARQELKDLSARHPQAVMGLGGRHDYALTGLRPLLPTAASAQVDYASYMDLEFAGLDDSSLRQAMLDCRIPVLLMPRQDAPFSMFSFYTYQGLFTPMLRRAYLSRYEVIDQTPHFLIARCNLQKSGE